MAGEKHDLDYYIDHPEEMPADFHTLGTDTEGDEGSESLAAAIGEEGAASSPAVKEESAKAVEPAKDDTGKQTEQVIKSRDGKHEIPYGVLAAEREARKAAESAVQQLTDRLEALEKAAKTGKPADVAAAVEAEPDLSDEELEQVAADFPAVAKLLKGLTGKIGNLQTQLSDVRNAESARGAREQKTASTTVQEAIDANPTLSYWQTTEPEAWAMAVKFDDQIKADKRNAGLSLEDRFEKVVKAMEVVYGPTELPPEFQARVATPAAKTDVPKDKGKDAKAKAEAVVKEAEGKTKEVGSLSDIPGGVPPEADEVQQLGQLSAGELGNKFLSMTPAQQNAILAKLAF